MEFENSLKNLRDSLLKVNNSESLRIFEDMQKNLIKETVDIIVIGEKSSGKSSLINLLINNNILPTGIGTSTFNVFYIQKDIDNKDNVTVQYLDGSEKELEFSKENLQNIKEGYKSIKHIDISLKDFPSDRIRILDVPGVGDVDEDLTEYVKSVLPITDSVIMVLDVTRGVTKNIIEILNADELKKYKDKLFVVFNKLDSVDEEELVGNMDKLDNEIKKYYNNLKIYHISTKTNYNNQLNQAEKLKKDINDYSIQVEVQKIKNSKIKNYLSSIKNLIEDHVKQVEIINGKNKLEIEEKLKKDEEDKKLLENQFEEFKNKLEEDISEIKKCISLKTDGLEKKLLAAVQNTISKDIKEEINLDIKNTIEDIKNDCLKPNLKDEYFKFNITFNDNEFTGFLRDIEAFLNDIFSIASLIVKEMPPVINKILNIFPISIKFIEEKMSKFESPKDKIKELIASLNELINEDVKKMQSQLEYDWDANRLSPIRAKIYFLEDELDKLKNEKDIADLKISYYKEEQAKIEKIINDVSLEY